MSSNLEFLVHERACNLTCAGCLTKVNIIRSGNSSERSPDIADSRPLTPYICNIALIRYEETWEVSSSMFPNRICTNCRLVLTNHPQDF